MRSQWPDREVITHLFAAALEQALEDVRQCEDGRPKVERVPLLLEHVELAADLVVLLEDLDVVTGLLQRDGGGQPAQTRPDDDDLFATHVYFIWFAKPVSDLGWRYDLPDASPVLCRNNPALPSDAPAVHKRVR